MRITERCRSTTYLAAKLTFFCFSLRPLFSSNHAVLHSSNSSNSRTTFVVAASSPAACRNRGGKRSSSRSSSVTFASAASAASSSSSSSSSPGDAEEDDEARFAEDYDALTDAIRVTAESLTEKLSGTPIYLVGMMGSGKSTVGKLVGAALRYQFFDTDQLIEAAASAEKEGASVSVADIFASEGEDAFREAETATLQALLPYTSVVVATGGGAVTQRRNWGLMQHGVVCWLDGPAALLASRAAKDGVAKRPLLQQQKAGGTAEEASTSGGASDAAADEEELEARLSGLLEKRREQYAIADLRVPLLSSSSSTGSKGSGGASPALVAFRLLRALERRIDGDAAAREEERKFEITGAGDVPQTMRVVPAKGGASSAGEGGGGAGGKGGKSSGGGGRGFGRKSNNSNGGGGAPAA